MKKDFYYSVEFRRKPLNFPKFGNVKTWSELDSIISADEIEFVCLSQKKSKGTDKYLVKIPTGNIKLPAIEYWSLKHFDRIFVIDTNTKLMNGQLTSVSSFLDMSKGEDGTFNYGDAEVFMFNPLAKVKLAEPPATLDNKLRSYLAPLAEKIGIIELYSARKTNNQERLLIVTDCNLEDLDSWNQGIAHIMPKAPPIPPNTYFGYASADKKNAHQLCQFMDLVNREADVSRH